MKLLKLLILAAILCQPIGTQAMEDRKVNPMREICDIGQIAIATGAMDNFGEIIECIPVETVVQFSLDCAKKAVQSAVQFATEPGCLFLLAMAAVEQQSQQ